MMLRYEPCDALDYCPTNRLTEQRVGRQEGRDRRQGGKRKTLDEFYGGRI